jgi:hypothetical protein
MAFGIQQIQLSISLSLKKKSKCYSRDTVADDVFCIKQVQAQLLQFAAKNIGLNPALLTSPINPQHMTMLNQLYQLQLVSGKMAGVPGQGRAPLTLCSYASTATPHSPSC